MSNLLSKNFNFFSLLRFAFPSMAMMVFTSLYTIIDGIFISQFVGTNALSATNIVYPAIGFIIGIGVMLATGGSAIVARNLGQGRHQRAREDFSFIVCSGFFFGLLLSFLGNFFLGELVGLLGANEILFQDCMTYLSVSLWFSSANILLLIFETFFVTEGKPSMSLFLAICGGITNIFLDYIFMGIAKMGIFGAALATGIGQLLPVIIGLCYFLFVRKNIYLVSFGIRIKTLTESCLNGSSEMVTNLSNSLVTFLFNAVMLRLLGEAGVAAITIVLYGQFLFNALYMGFSMGVAPVISYNYGSENHLLLKRIYKICMFTILISSCLISLLAWMTSSSIVAVFTPSYTETYTIAAHGFSLFSINYIFAGINIFASSMFTAFSDGKTSAILSFIRTFGFVVLSILFLPNILGVDGIWLAVPAAEFLSMFLSVYYFFQKKDIFHYM